MADGFVPPSGVHDASCAFLCKAPKAECAHSCGVCDAKRASNVRRCNCENSACPHEASACRNAAEQGKRLQYVGAVCWACWNYADPKYRI